MNFYKEIKNALIDNEINRRVKNYSINKNDLSTYYNVGKLLSEAGKHYGEGIIKEYSKRLTIDIGKGYGISNLKRMRQFYYMIEKGVAMPHQLSWSHILMLLPLNDVNEINYYINIALNNNYSYRELGNKIKSHEYERLPIDTRNKLIKQDDVEVKDLVPNPILIRNKDDINVINEKTLHELIMDNIESFMNELGDGFCFKGSEYKIKIGDRYNYIDFLLYNYKFKCFVVIELKVTEINSNHTGQIQNYMNYIDKNVKEIDDNKTVGIIICKKDNKFVIEYCSDPRIIVREYKLI